MVFVNPIPYKITDSGDFVPDIECFWQDPANFDNIVVIVDGPWENDYKYDKKSTTFMLLDNYKYYKFTTVRTGSYYSDYYYDYPKSASRVVPRTRTITFTEYVAAK